VPIQGGARLTGKAGAVNVGFLNMQTDDVVLPSGVVAAPGNNFTATRVNRDLPNRSSVGAIFVNRTATGSHAGSDNWNRTWGLDGKWGIGESWTLNGFGARTETPGAVSREHAFSGGVEFRARRRNANVSFTEVGEDFNPEVGFLERTDGYRQLNSGWHENVRSSRLTSAGFRELRPHVTYESYWGFDGLQETATLHMDNHFDWESGYLFSPAFNVQYEGLREPFEIYPGVIVPPGNYQSLFAAWMGNTDRRKPMSLSVSWNYGGFLSGNQNIISPSLNFRQGADFTASFRWTRSDIDLPQGAFVTNLGTVRASYSFTTLANVQALIQYNDRTRRWSTNLRFNWLRTAATGLYVVYNDTEAFEGLGPINRAFIVKYSHMFDILQ
jgi:hypothetical protein